MPPRPRAQCGGDRLRHRLLLLQTQVLLWQYTAYRDVSDAVLLYVWPLQLLLLLLLLLKHKADGTVGAVLKTAV